MRRLFLFAFLLALVLVVAGCSSNSFVGRRYDNFTAYYNTFYNAKQKFEEGVAALEQKQQPINRNLYLPLFPEASAATNTQTFTDAIDKAADVLREHPNSKWVDDAIVLIGKAYFYLQNYVGAEQKFREAIAIGSRLQDESRFWLARTLIAAGAFDEAEAHIQESLLREDLSKRWAAKLHLALGELYVERGAVDAAAEELATGLDAVRDNALAARAQFLLGQLYESLGRYEEATDAFARVDRYAPFYELSYAGQLSAIRVAGLHSDPDAAMKRLRRMERDDKHFASRAELVYLRGRLLQTAGRPEAALDTYYDLLYNADPTTNIQTVRGRVHYALGEIYRDLYSDYPLASAHFDTAATALRQQISAGGAGRGTPGATTPELDESDFSPEAIIDGEEQAETFRSFATVYQKVARVDSLLRLGSLDAEAFEAFVVKLREQRAKELAAEQKELERRQAEQGFTSVGESRTRGGERGGESSLSSGDGFLFHRNRTRVQEGLVSFVTKWGERPLVPNWRRQAAISGIASQDGNAARGADVPATLLSGAGETALPDVDVSAVPRDSVSQAAMLAERALVRYELGNVLFLSMNRPDSAAAWYRMVIEEDREQPVAQRALYALAEVQRSLGDTLASRTLYRQALQDYPESDFADRIREHLGLAPAVKVETDSTALAEEAYAEAYARWQRGRHRDALPEMLATAARYRSTEVAPRALLAAGTIYLEWANRDSLDLDAALPTAGADSLLQAVGFLPDPPPPAPTEAPEKTEATAPGVQPSAPPPVEALADSSAAPAVMPADSLAALADTLSASLPPLAEMPDSLAASPDSSLAPPMAADTLMAANSLATAQAQPEPLHLGQLYGLIVENYSKSPQADQARRLLKALQERETALQAARDSLAAAEAAIVAAADSALARPDSALVPADSALAAPDAAFAVPDSAFAVPDTTLAEPATPKQVILKETKEGAVPQEEDLREATRLRRERGPTPIDSTAADTSAADSTAAPPRKESDAATRPATRRDAGPPLESEVDARRTPETTPPDSSRQEILRLPQRPRPPLPPDSTTVPADSLKAKKE